MRAGSRLQAHRQQEGAHIRDRTGDLSLTKTVLYLLSYVGRQLPVRYAIRAAPAGPSLVLARPEPEPTKGLEPLTYGLQNRCSAN